MNRNDLVKFTLQWVWGMCILWNMDAKQFAADSVEMQEFVHRMHGVVWRYLTRRGPLDGSCSDLEFQTALDAVRIFGHHVTK